MLFSNSFQALATLEQVIDHNFVIVTPHMPVAEAIALMSQQQSSLALVMEQQQLLGIFTERDVLRVIASTKVLEQVAIAQVMTCPLMTLSVTQAQDIVQVLSILRQHRIGYLPIVDDWGQVMGVVTSQKLGELLIEMSTSIQALPQVAEQTIAPIQTPLDAATNQALLSQEISDVYDELRLRKQAAKELKHAQIFLNSLLEHLPVGVFAKDAKELRFVFWNEFCTYLMGYSAAEALGKSDYDLFPQQQAEFCTNQDREALTTGKIVANLEEVVHTAHLGQRIFRVTKVPIFDEVGRAQYVMGIVEDITERKQAEAAKRDAENKSILLQEIHHRVKNNLQIVSGLLYLQSRLVEDEQTLQMLQDSRNRLQAMGLIHEKLYNSENIDSIDFRDYIQSLTETLFISYANNTTAIALTLNIAPVLLDLDTAIPCGLIVNELVSNALKYAFIGKKTGEITVEFNEEGGNNFDLSVRDDGIGMAEEINCQTQKSLGMRLVYSLVTQQLEGTLELDRSNGTTFRIRFPKQST